MIDALPLLLGPEGYQISRSVRLRSSASATLTRTPSVDGNRKKWTWSAWVKRGSLGSLGYLMSCRENSGNDGIAAIYFSGDQLFTYYDTNTTNPAGAVGPAVYRDPSAWYHIVWVVDAANTIHYVYVNNVLVSTDTSKYPPNYDYAMNRNGYVQNMGAQAWGPANYLDGYITEVNFIDGQALTPSSFGETNPVTGVWQPKKYTGTYGTNGFYLNFSDNSAATAAAIGKDYSGNGNNWTPNNINVSAYTGTPPNNTSYDSMLDVPTPWGDGGNGRGNYAVLNPLDKTSTTTAADGNLGLTLPANVAGGCGSTIAVSSGQWYVEVTPTSGSNSLIGIVLDSLSQNGANSLFSTGYGYYQFNGNKYVNGTASAYGATYAANDVIGIALDLTNLTLTFYKNNTSQGAISIAAGSYKFSISNGSSTVAQVSAWNFGQRPFAYTPPSGFKALNTLNLPTPTILKGNQYFDAPVWTGDGVTPKSFTFLNFQPDLVWSKNRSVVSNHQLNDSVRGANLRLRPDTTDVEAANAANGYLTSFDANGFSVAAGATDNQNYNKNTQTFVAWCWKEGATQGIDIVTYTGDATTNRAVAHSLGVQPSMFIIKARSASATSWIVHHKDMGNNGGSPSYLQYCLLESTAAKAASTSLLPSANLSSTTFPTSGATNNTNVNGNGTTYVAYLFSEVAGFSKFGSYTGNVSADGPFVFCGFRPRFVMFKRTDSATGGDWAIYDTSRDSYNAATTELYPDNTLADTTAGGASMDILSNGFKIRNSRTGINASGGTYIFAAFAESPFKNALAR